jgi:hypothetical protein
MRSFQVPGLRILVGTMKIVRALIGLHDLLLIC